MEVLSGLPGKSGVEKPGAAVGRWMRLKGGEKLVAMISRLSLKLRGMNLTIESDR